MTDAELAEIEEDAEIGCGGDVKVMYDICAHTVPALIAEIRRLRQEASDNGPGAGFSVS